MGPIESHLEQLQARMPDATMTAVPGTGWVIRVPHITLPAGWSKGSTGVVFVAPQGYPFANPDCFWADADLRLANNGIPQNAQVNNTIPGTGETALWFSWHLQQPWSPNRDDLLTWIGVVKQRLARPV